MPSRWWPISHPETGGASTIGSWKAPEVSALVRPRSRSVVRSLVIAGIVGCRSVSPSAKTEAQAAISTVAPSVPGTSPEAPISSQANAQIIAITTITRVRRLPSMRWSTTSWSTTITRVLQANAMPSPWVETSLTTRA